MKISTSTARESSAEKDLLLQQERVRAITSRARQSSRERELRVQQDRRRKQESRIVNQHSDLKLGAFNYNSDYDYCNHPNVVIGRMDVICNHCRAKKYKCEPAGMCCSNGKVRLLPLNEPPESLLSYLSGSTANSKHF